VLTHHMDHHTCNTRNNSTSFTYRCNK